MIWQRVPAATAEHPVERVERAADVAAGDRVGEVPRRHTALLDPEEALELVGPDRRAGAE